MVLLDLKGNQMKSRGKHLPFTFRDKNPPSTSQPRVQMPPEPITALQGVCKQNGEVFDVTVGFQEEDRGFFIL